MKRKYLFYLLLCVLACTACHSSGKSGKEETLYSGEIRIAVDESFKPIMEEELQVYQALTPEAVIHPIYCSEVEAVSLLLKDSVRLAVTHRRLTEEELASFHARKFFPESARLATSGVAQSGLGNHGRTVPPHHDRQDDSVERTEPTVCFRSHTGGFRQSELWPPALRHGFHLPRNGTFTFPKGTENQ
mgnify:CR=1 FL=1